MGRNFEEWLSKFEKTVATWNYYTDFPKVYKNLDKIKVELNILNSLIGSNDIENEFIELVKEYPKVLNVIPILIAKRESVILIKDAIQNYAFNFKKMNYTVEEYVIFMRKSGIFELLEKHLIANLYDYVTGVEVGLDTNARKNRTGTAMEQLVESHLVKTGFIKDYNYFCQMKATEIKEKWNIDLTIIENKLKKVNDKKAEKKFDFAIKTDNMLYVIETNFYGSQGSKLNEVARSYKMIEEETRNISGVTFIWITDGAGWNTAKNNLHETFDVMEHIYSIDDIKNGIIEKLK